MKCQKAGRSTALIVTFAVLLLLGAPLSAQQPSDSTNSQKVRHLREVRVSAEAPRNDIEATAPAQAITQERIERQVATQLSDVAKEFTGVTLRDYGGVGGIKSFSARGLGSQFSSLVIDGIVVGDAQNGQVDLGRYVIDGLRQISFSNAQQESLLQSARGYAAGNVLSLESGLPAVDSARPTRIRLALRGGSFGLIAPTLQWHQRIGKRLTFSLLANHTRCRGDYPFTLYYTASRQDSSSREVRHNSQMRSTTIDADISYRPSAQRLLTVKARHLSSYHALPGPVRYYHIKESEHSEEQLSFLQARYRLHSGSHSLQLLAKAQRSLDIYEDTAPYNAKFVHNEYRQQELYGSGCYRYRTSAGLSFAASGDAWKSTLNSNLPRYSDVARRAMLGALAAEYERARIKADVSLLATNVIDEPADDTASRYPLKITPYCGVNVTLVRHDNASVKARLFYKETYRIPTFNELYYYTVSHSLRPEHARQANIGLIYSQKLRQGRGGLAATADFYRNMVSDKIIAIPMQNMYLWSMANLGLVEIYGLDARADMDLRGRSTEWTAHVSYSLQRAVDATEPGSKTYGHQIPYTPRHSGGAGIAMHSRVIDVMYEVMCVGKRYSRRQNNDDSYLPPYADHSVSIGREFPFDIRRREWVASVRFKVQNLLNVQYEVVRNYPMMGRNYVLMLTFNN